MTLEEIWTDYGFERLQEGLNTLFPTYSISAAEMLERLCKGDVIGVLSDCLEQTIGQLAGETIGLKNLFVWLLLLGILSALMIHFVEVFDKNQVADLSFYFLYLLIGAILLKAFSGMAELTVDALSNMVLFGQMLLPVYLVAVFFATGSLTAGAYYELLLVILCLVEQILLKVAVPMVYSYCMLAVLNGIWAEEKLKLFMELLGKVLGWIFKAALWIVTGMSVFQSLLTPIIDSLKNNALGYAITALPGVGNGAESIMKLAAGSAMIIKNSVGVGLLILLLCMCLIPFIKLFLVAILIKLAAAFMGIVSDKRITACTNQIGEGIFFLLKLLGTAMFLLFLMIAIAALTTNRGMIT